MAIGRIGCVRTRHRVAHITQRNLQRQRERGYSTAFVGALAIIPGSTPRAVSQCACMRTAWGIMCKQPTISECKQPTLSQQL
eukprot:1510016-Rhodomonas_salina.1